MKTIILLACLLMSGCQAFIYSSAPPLPPQANPEKLDVTVRINDSLLDIKGFKLSHYLRESSVFERVSDTSDAGIGNELLLVAKLESGRNGSAGLEFLSIMTTASTLFVLPGASPRGYSLRYYLLDSRGQVVTSYVYQKNATVVTGLLVPPIDGVLDERHAATGDSFGGEFAREATDHFIRFLQEDRGWLERVRYLQEQKDESDRIFEALGVVAMK